MTLDDIMFKHGADKASSHPAGGHDFARHYERFFEPLREDPILLVEIGVGSGNSHRGWLQYFPYAAVLGIDKVRDTNEWNTVGIREDCPYRFMVADQTDETFYKCLTADFPHGFNIAIDDGGHHIDQVIASFKGLWPLIVPSGYYCIEDLGVGGTPGSVFLKPGYPTHMQFVHSLMERADVDSFYFAGELLILRKK